MTTDPDPKRDWLGRVVSFETFAKELGERVAAYEAKYGPIDVAKLRNSGKNRTASKRALLKAIEDAGGKW